jgi:hypothetical protein
MASDESSGDEDLDDKSIRVYFFLGLPVENCMRSGVPSRGLNSSGALGDALSFGRAGLHSLPSLIFVVYRGCTCLPA